jgi:hypothetical protein
MTIKDKKRIVKTKNKIGITYFSFCQCHNCRAMRAIYNKMKYGK